MNHEKKSKIKNYALILCIITLTITITGISGKKNTTDYLTHLKTEKLVYKSGKYLPGRPYHPLMGRESYSAFTLFSFGNNLYLGRKYGITIVNTRKMSAMYLPIKTEKKYDLGTRITSIYVTGKNIWAGMNNGSVFKYHIKSGYWKMFRLASSGPVSLTIIGGLIYAAAKKGIYIYNPMSALFYLNFKLPEDFPIKYLKISKLKKWIYMCTSMGLIRYSQKPHLRWEMLGARDHLTKAIIHDSTVSGDILLLAASRVQSVFLPANIKITSYGTFYYNYFQKRWERKPWNVRENLKLFMEVNRNNTIIPNGGIWIYNSLTDKAVRIKGLAGDFFKIIKYKKRAFAAGSRNGIFKIKKIGKNYKFVKRLLLKNLWIDDIAVNSGKLAVLSGKNLYILNL